ncbi:ATP-dependent helicase [Anthocerotibacter panamensis]|uniref:ATP-dependent helicase n=1 Tax=Anthocerotibacter panamensis TaxID=2857077 RepID=UPI001C408997|nr:ATP-dependent helicase [Anthocerotibacter panamensis]
MSERTDQDHFLQHYQGGYIGLTATPGAGKTTLLVRLIHQLLAQGVPIEHLLVLSYTRAASFNFRERLLAAHPQLQASSLENICTIHSCAYRLIRPHLTRWGYADRPLTPILTFQKKSIIEELVNTWLPGREREWQQFLVPGCTPDAIRAWQLKLVDLAEEGISLAKQQQISATQLQELKERYPDRFFLSLTSAVYTAYQSRLRSLNLLDFDDMVNLAIQLLEQDETVRQTWQSTYYYLLEDEAQDSTRAQHKLLSLLAGPTGNWIRVGDPNQAIFSSFTAADPRYLVDFCQEYEHYTLTQAGRSVEPVIEMANWFLEQVYQRHPHPTARQAFFRQFIRPTGTNPQPTPHSQPRIWAVRDRVTEHRQVLEKAVRYLKAYPDHSLGVLAFSHKSLDELAGVLQQWEMPFIDRRQGSAGDFFKRLIAVVRWVYDPLLPARDLWLHLGQFEHKPLVLGLFNQLSPIDWLDGKEPWHHLPQWKRLGIADRKEFSRLTGALHALYRQRGAPLVEFWLEAARLVDPSPQAVATAEHLALAIIDSGQARTLPQLMQFLNGQKGREFLLRWSALTPDEGAEVKGQIELCTLHSAKGREWDGVFIVGVTDFWFPTDHEGTFQGQLEYVTIYPQAQLKSEFYLDEPDTAAMDFAARVKDDIITERLRLLYVGLTRPRYYLSLSSHGQPAQVFQWLQEAFAPRDS